MLITYKKTKRGYVLITLLLISGILAVIAGALVRMGSGSLFATQRDYSGEQALFAAEAGLVAAAEQYARDGDLPIPFTGSLNGGRGTYDVALYNNTGTDPMPVPGGVTIPPGTLYMVSTGSGDDTRQKKAAALFRTDMGIFQVGALAENVVGTNSTFAAFDSSLEPSGHTGAPHPSSVQPSEMVLATNEDMGLRFQFTNATVDGGVFMGPGGNPTVGIQADATTTIGFTGSLGALMNVPTIEVPAVGLPNQGDFDDVDTTISTVTLANTNFNPPSGGEMVITRNCLTLTVQANGDFEAYESGSSSICTGNLFTETVTSATNSYSAPGSISFSPFNISGTWHNVVLDPANGLIGAEDFGPTGDPITSPPPAPVFGSMPGWMNEFLGGPPSTSTGGTLQQGTYGDVTIDDTSTILEDGGTYVVDNLRISSGGRLTLPAGASNVNIYVTGSIDISGADAIINETRQAPNLNIFYTGTSPVNLAGGAQAFHTLTAPGADVVLQGNNASFFGAIIARNLEVHDANFFFDVATEGVGAGMAGTHIQMVARVRP